MASSDPLSTIFQCIDQNEDKLLERLREAITILPNESPEKSPNSTELLDWMNQQLKSFGFTTTLKTIEDDSRSSLPPVIFANLEKGHCPNKSTILVYSHLEGRSDPTKVDGCNVEAEQASEENVYIKGVLNVVSVMAWLNAIEAFRAVEIDIPVNIKFIVASVESESSLGFRNLLISEKEDFLGDVDYICINEGYWLQSDTPSLVKKLRGSCYFSIQVQSSARSLDSNKYSGIIQEATNDLLYLIGCLIDEKGNLNHSEINLQVDDLPKVEQNLFETTDLDLDKFMKGTGANSLSHNGDKSEIMKFRVIMPYLTIHNIESFADDMNESSIPSHASAKLSIRCFQRKMSEVFDLVNTFLQKHWALRKSSNDLRITLDRSHETWFANLNHVHYETAKKAAQNLYKKQIHFLNSGLTIPVINTLEEVINKNILILPISSENSYMNGTIPNKNYLDASKMFATYLQQMGDIPKISSESSASFISCDTGPEVCVCGRAEEEVEEEIPAGSGDAESAQPTKSISEDEAMCVCPYRPQLQTKDEAVTSEDLLEEFNPAPPPPPPKPCKCILQYQPVDVEIISLKSTPSKDATPAPDEKTQKKNITASVDTIRCVCVPEQYRILKHKKEKCILPEKEEELMKSMRSVGSKISGISACEYPSSPHEKTPKMNILGCVCPERSQETIFGEEIQRDRMLCPVEIGRDEICNKGGKRRHHISGPPPIDEDESEISLGPLSHCSCPSEESIVVPPNCDCSKNGALPIQNKENINDEID